MRTLLAAVDHIHLDCAGCAHPLHKTDEIVCTLRLPQVEGSWVIAYHAECWEQVRYVDAVRLLDEVRLGENQRRGRTSSGGRWSVCHGHVRWYLSGLKAKTPPRGSNQVADESDTRSDRPP